MTFSVAPPVPKEVGGRANNLPGIALGDVRIVKVVPLLREWVLATGCIVTAVEATKVIRHADEVVKDGLRCFSC